VRRTAERIVTGAAFTRDDQIAETSMREIKIPNPIDIPLIIVSSHNIPNGIRVSETKRGGMALIHVNHDYLTR
jgi:hypothetical protein